jgi:hypothetical protein
MRARIGHAALLCAEGDFYVGRNFSADAHFVDLFIALLVFGPRKEASGTGKGIGAGIRPLKDWDQGSAYQPGKIVSTEPGASRDKISN